MLAELVLDYDARCALQKLTAEEYKTLRSKIGRRLPENPADLGFSETVIIGTHDEISAFNDVGVTIGIRQICVAKPLNELIGNSYKIEIPNIGLLAIDTVCVKEDCCTDELQEFLNNGWRIIAVCPAATRRPDYVLGKRGGES